jgi:serine/threonine protein kinase
MTTDFGHYEVLSELGRGGMGIVYQALDRRNQRMVAIKQLVLDNIDPKKQREFQDRFKREAHMASRLDHANIVTVFDVEAESNYYVMEFLDGHSLRKELELRGGKMVARELWSIFKQVASGLAYAHSFNVVHRDVKPDNIFILKDGTVKLTDFGIARTVDYEQTHLTKTGVMLGTLAYVSPEQLQDAKNVDHRADIFSLGVVCYESLSGKLPFTGEGIAGTVIKILTSEAEPLHSLNQNVSVEIGAVVSKAIRKKARDRFMSVLDFAKEFERALVTSPPASSPSSGSGAQLSSNSGVDNSASSHIYTPGIPIEIKSKGSVSNLGSRPASEAALIKTADNDDIVHQTKVSMPPAAFYLVRPVATIGRKGEGNGCFVEPAAVCSRNGRLAVADTALRKVQVFAKDGRFLCAVHANPDIRDSKTNGGSLTNPSGLSMDFRGRLYASDSSDHYVRVFDAMGTFVKEIYNLHGRDGGIQGLVCDSTGLLYLSDADNACLQVFQSDLGTWMRRVGGKGRHPGQFQMPSGLAVDRFNQIYVVDYTASIISVFAKSGVFQRSFGGKGTGNGLFNVPRGIAVDKFDRIYIADSLNHRVQVFGPAGEWIYSFGGRGSEVGKFVSPSGLSIDPDNNCLYVVDRGNQRIQVFEIMFD